MISQTRYNYGMCYNCGSELIITGIIGRDAECPNCGASVRCCKNCQWYEPGAHYDCHETVDEPVQDKERPTFCDFFRLNTKAACTDRSSQATKVQNARDAFNALFGDD